MDFHNTYAVVDLDTIAQNFQAIQEKAQVPVMAVVKADAYGHGAVPVAQLLQDRCAFFGVSSVPEALELRQAGISTPILILGPAPAAAYPQLIPAGIRPTIACYEDAVALSQAATQLGMDAPFHIAVDTGMGRIGFQTTAEDADICARIAQLPGLVAEGIFSHFATADCADLSAAQQQVQQFDRFVEMLEAKGIQFPLRHLSNSAGIMNFDCHYNMVRAGIVLYGMYPSDETDPSLLQIRPALSWYSRVTHVKTLESGRPISYGGTFVTQKQTRVATVAAGYGDGYHRSLSNRFYVLIRGKKAPILGRVCMDQFMVDVSDIPDVQPGDPVVLIGTDDAQTITMEQIAECSGSFNYEFSCGLSRRVHRVYRPAE